MQNFLNGLPLFVQTLPFTASALNKIAKKITAEVRENSKPIGTNLVYAGAGILGCAALDACLQTPINSVVVGLSIASSTIIMALGASLIESSASLERNKRKLDTLHEISVSDDALKKRQGVIILNVDITKSLVKDQFAVYEERINSYQTERQKNRSTLHY
ncbi:MAG: hypothetical protein ACK5WY_08970 [Holosporaceae bacterium]|jgi:hypothetical protein